MSEGGQAWARFEVALDRYFDAEIAVLEAAAKMAASRLSHTITPRDGRPPAALEPQPGVVRDGVAGHLFSGAEGVTRPQAFECPLPGAGEKKAGHPLTLADHIGRAGLLLGLYAIVAMLLPPITRTLLP